MENLPSLFREKIIGKEVKNILLEEDGLGISLIGGWDINVWSAITLYLLRRKVDLSRISELVGASLIQFVGDNVHERLVFSNGFEVIVDLATRKSSQPEAMMVRGPEKLFVVWND
jgi:hypothetical protein